MRFRDRRDAGRELAQRLLRLRDRKPVVLALPRGGVPVAFEIARALAAPLDVLVARKLGAPGQPELGIGALAECGGIYVNNALVEHLGVSAAYLERVTSAERVELQRRVETYRGDRPPLEVQGRTVIVVDDGLATGATMHAAVRSLRMRQPHAIVVAVPACAPDVAARLRHVVDEVVCALAPADFDAVGSWYESFDQTQDSEVMALLERSRSELERALRERYTRRDGELRHGSAE